jgi:hypothetical protein
MLTSTRNLQRSDISLASAYINNLPADEVITKRFPESSPTTTETEAHHRVDVTNREYVETRAQAHQKRQSHYKFRIGSDGKPVRRGFMERRAETSTKEEDEILPAAALPIKRRREMVGLRVLVRGMRG